jgi:hypothetical protein
MVGKIGNIFLPTREKNQNPGCIFRATAFQAMPHTAKKPNKSSQVPDCGAVPASSPLTLADKDPRVINRRLLVEHKVWSGGEGWGSGGGGKSGSDGGGIGLMRLKSCGAE